MLEVGAAKAWASRFWLERDCEYVATDILVDPNIGLGRGAFYGDFARIQADGEHLPFADETFDLTYCVATLHHALDLTQMVREMARVTRPGGVVAGLNEGVRGVLRGSVNPDQAGEIELGINEHVHSVVGVRGRIHAGGARVRRLERPDGWPPRPYGRLLSQHSEDRDDARDDGPSERDALRRRLDLRAEARVSRGVRRRSSIRTRGRSCSRGSRGRRSRTRTLHGANLSRRSTGSTSRMHDPLLTRRPLRAAARRDRLEPP